MLGRSSGQPHLQIVIEPETKIRFRYISEGGSHGGLTGKIKEEGKKTYPTVKLVNYYGGYKSIYIRVSLYTEDKKPHILEFKGKKGEEGKQFIKENLQDDFTAKFANMQILSKKKDEIEKILMDRKLKNLKDGLTPVVKKQFEKTYGKEVKDRAKEILNSVRLYFEAFKVGEDVAIASVFSDVICNQKAAAQGDLIIHRLSHAAGSCKGGEEMILLCSKVDKKNIKIRFFETDDRQKEIWFKHATFQQADVHYQVAIPFKTPPYKENAERRVYICLERNEEFSEPREFTYIPEGKEEASSKKRKYNHEEIAVPLSPDSTMFSPESIFSLAASSSDSCGNDETLEINLADDGGMHDIKTIDDFISFLDCGESDYQLPFEQLGAVEGQMDVAGPQMAIQYDVAELSNGMQNLKIKSTPRLLQSDSNKRKIFANLLKKKDILGNTLLHLAVLKKKNVIPILKYIASSNIDIINEKNFKKQTALHFATEMNNTALVRHLLRNGGNPNIRDASGNNCYHVAVMKESDSALREIVGSYLISPELSTCNYEGLTPFHIAIKNKSEKCFQILLQYAKNVNVVDQKSGRSLLHYAVEFAPSFVRLLLCQDTVDVDIQDFEGNTPLHIACAREDIDVVRQLLEAGANPQLKNFKLNYNIQKTSESNSDGELPADLTTNTKILQLLDNSDRVINSPFSSYSDNLSGSNKMNCQTVEKLCKYLDEDTKWRIIAIHFVEENCVNSLELSLSPTRALLTYIEKEHMESYIEKLIAVLEIYGLKEAIRIIEEGGF